jgi:hypothetical protein
MDRSGKGALGLATEVRLVLVRREFDYECDQLKTRASRCRMRSICVMGTELVDCYKCRGCSCPYTFRRQNASCTFALGPRRRGSVQHIAPIPSLSYRGHFFAGRWPLHRAAGRELKFRVMVAISRDQPCVPGKWSTTRVSVARGHVDNEFAGEEPTSTTVAVADRDKTQSTRLKSMIGQR